MKNYPLTVCASVLLIVFLLMVGGRSYGVNLVETSKIQSKANKKIGVCLVLGGGGARGTAHIAVLEALEEEGIPIDMIVGSSVGSVIGAFYADSLSAQKVKEKVLPLKMWDFLDVSYVDTICGLIGTTGGVNGESLKNYIRDHVSAKNIEDLKMPLILVTTDIVENELFVIEKGPLASSVHASAALPPVFTPVELHGRILVDGAVLEPVPVSTAKKYSPKMIIAVNIISPPQKGKVDNMVSLAYRSFDNAYCELARLQSKMADVDIQPDLKGFGMFEDHRSFEAYERGREAAQKALPLIRERMAALGIAASRKTVKKDSKKSMDVKDVGYGKELDYYERFNRSLMRRSAS